MRYRTSHLLHFTCYAALGLTVIVQRVELTREREKRTDVTCKLLQQTRLAEYWD